MKKILTILFSLAVITPAWFISCENKNEEDLFGEADCDTSVVTWSADIKPIIENRCYECHSGSNPISGRNFDTYDGFVFWVNYTNNPGEPGRVYGAVNRLSGYSWMPNGRPKLPQCELDKINKWIREGAQNN